jgi:hypothetical protein
LSNVSEGGHPQTDCGAGQNVEPKLLLPLEVSVNNISFVPSLNEVILPPILGSTSK